MATRTLVTSFLSRLTNANHDGVTQQIDDRLQAYTTDNQLLTAAVAAAGSWGQVFDMLNNSVG